MVGAILGLDGLYVVVSHSGVTLMGAMVRAGFRPDEAGKVIGGNYVRIFAASAG